MDKVSTELVFFVNGKKVVESNPDPEWTIIYYLRQKLKLCGVKLGCSEGGCGACTVMLSKYNRLTKKICHFSVNTCLLSVCALHGLAVTTVEGIGNMNKLHPVQERIAKAHGSQCGFCTPGIVMSMYSLLRNNQKPTMEDMDVTFQGNLCRCTGYRPIIEGYRTFAEGDCPMTDSCCKSMSSQGSKEKKLFEPKEFEKYNPAQELIFPPELRCDCELDKQFLIFKGKEVTWYRPLTLEQLLDLKHKFPEAKLVLGSTEIGIETKFKKMYYPVLIHAASIPELKDISTSCCVVRIGASVTINQLKYALMKQIELNKVHKTRILAAIVDMIKYFAGEQIRNVASIAGNIITSCSISDLNQIFLAANCILEVNSKARGFRKVKIDKNFFTGYRKNAIEPDEVVIAINIPFTSQNQYFYAYKQSKRRDDDIAIVNAAFNVIVVDNKISDIKIAYGGMSMTTVSAPKTEQALIGQNWNERILEIAYENLIKDLPLQQNAPGGMVAYRKTLALSFFFRAYLAISEELGLDLPSNYKSGISGFKNQIPKSSQYFQLVSNEKCTDAVGKPIVHTSAYKQTCGEAVFTDDIPTFNRELYAGLVLSTHTYADIINIDPSEALEVEGVHAFFCAKDIDPDKNKYGTVVRDEDIFASKQVTCQGQLIGIVLAENQLTAQKAARKVKVEYKDLCSPIISIEEAIKKKSYYSVYKIDNPCIDTEMESSDHIIEGDVRTGAQEHFYLEPYTALVIPKLEDNEIEIIATTQNPSEVASMVAHMLDIPINRVVCKVKRCGGGFGGKETRSILLILPLAFAATKLKRPVRCMLDRDEDMLLTGKRHPFLFKYKIGFSNCGKIKACEIHSYSNGGNSLDLSSAVMLRSMLHSQNAYKIPYLRVIGYACKTNLASNTAFRGFGGPQSMFAIETIIRHVADYLDKDVVQISEMNLQQEGDITHYNQQLSYCTLQKCWDECLEKADHCNLKNQVKEFNLLNRWKKRGIAVVPTMYGVAFSINFHNQAGAIVHVYTDGSVLISHGGVELGQGLHTKMIQIASRVLGAPIQDIYICETSTDKVPNGTATAASSASDLNGMAVKNACEQIKERLKPIKEKNPSGSFKDWANEAFFSCTSLSAAGYYNICSDIKYSIDTNRGQAFNYYTFGVACSVVEIDCLTGDHQILKTEIVMDLGESLNPAIDIGQIEGAFVQGYGLYVIEEMLYSSSGTMWTRGPGTYKIPGFSDIPLEFNVSLLKGAPNPRAVYSSKAVGEPPLFLSSSVAFAIREAIKAARKDACVKEPLKMNAPYTAAKIRMACVDDITRLLDCAFKVGSDMPWNIDV